MATAKGFGAVLA